MSAPVILWFRRDLRLNDNPALAAAVASGRPILPLYILEEGSNGSRPLGAASRWWLHHSLASLDADIARCRWADSDRPPLLLRRGPAAEVLHAVVRDTGSEAVYWNRCYEPALVARDRGIKSALEAAGVESRSFNASLLFEPWTVATKSGDPFRVFTPFWRACRTAPEPSFPDPAPARIALAAHGAPGDDLTDWDLVPTAPDWADGLREAWRPGEPGARARLRDFAEGGAAAYEAARDRPDLPGTSALSPHLHFGEIGPRQAWHALEACLHQSPSAASSVECLRRELGWRDFCAGLLFNFPDMVDAPLRPEFAAFPWLDDAEGLAAWQRGTTGFPIVDAGMRQLWRTGWMHNRVRMIAASFLVKDLLVDWRRGEAWFWDTLVDADRASNVANWQWVAGCGADAAPYFRIFNPVRQGEKFDPKGDYVRRWVPELAALPNEFIHRPWDAPDALRAPVVYPGAIVDHAQARRRALDAFAASRRRP